MKGLTVFLIMLTFYGCATLGGEKSKEEIRPAVNAEAKAGVGDIFFVQEVNDRRPFAAQNRINMKVKRLNDREFVLEYSESKTYTFSTSDKTIRLKGYEFEIIGVEKGKLIYKRIK